MSQNEKKPELQIQIPPQCESDDRNLLEGRIHSRSFILATPPVGVVSVRVIVSPAHAKRILQALTDNIARYEAVFGTIDANLPSPPPMRH